MGKMTSEQHLMADWFFGLLLIAALIGIGVWIWRTKPIGFWKPLGYWATLWGILAAGQLATRGISDARIGVAVQAWLAALTATAVILGIRHLLARRQSGKVAS